jgi:hypothetical protein
MTIYIAVIWPKIDYADVIKDSATTSYLHNYLDQIRAADLKIWVGAKKNTPIEILQVELDKQPLLPSIYGDFNMNSKSQQKPTLYQTIKPY